MQATLIETTSPLYAKRLVREIRSTLASGQGVYFQSYLLPSNPRIGTAMFSPKFGAIFLATSVGHLAVCSGQWDQFIDGHGQTLCASRSK